MHTRTMIRLTETGHRAAAPGRMLGVPVTDRDGTPLGTVDDLIVDADARRYRLISVEHGGVTGFGATPSFIPVEAVDAVSRHEIRIGTSIALGSYSGASASSARACTATTACAPWRRRN